MLRLVIVLSLLLALTACSTKQKNIKKESYKPQTNNAITNALYLEYQKWYGTPHKLGGITKDGLDCSSLIQIIYRDTFNIKLPRTTKEQAKVGYLISKKSTIVGDLVFFKIGYNSRHAGIIIEGDKFIHTSQKNGVSISNLNNPYWKSKYWQSRRVLP